jgi:ATP-binding protein involved in chromosome partitioning
MAPFTSEHGETYALFGEGGGQRLADRLGVPLVGSIPLHPDMAQSGDSGSPVAAGDGPMAATFADLAQAIVTDIAPPVDGASCTARLLQRVEATLAADGS